MVLFMFDVSEIRDTTLTKNYEFLLFYTIILLTVRFLDFTN